MKEGLNYNYASMCVALLTDYFMVPVYEFNFMESVRLHMEDNVNIDIVPGNIVMASVMHRSIAGDIRQKIHDRP